MTPHQFIDKWKPAELSERSACQQHFLDLCELLNQPKPADVDKTGAWYTFEKGISKDTGNKGYADVWYKDHFGWEYKGKRKNLAAAYDQLKQYREALENPPLLIVCDLDRFEVHTNFTGTAKVVHAFDLDGLAEPKNIALLRSAFTDPYSLKPGLTPEQVTEDVAGKFADLADGMRNRGVPAEAAAHFLMKLMFCMFAEDIDLLPPKLFYDTVKAARGKPAELSEMLADLFGKMAKGGRFGRETINWFNGGLFNDAAVIDLLPGEMAQLQRVAECDWSNVEPSVFGTLFERMLIPEKRSQLGAHYTSRKDIETLLRPVMFDPLQREWAETKAKADKLRMDREKKAKPADRAKAKLAFERCVNDFLFRLAHVTVLDPACGSGNFLYVAINLLLDLEKEVITYANSHGMAVLLPAVRPTQLRGLELNPYAQQLAQVVIWIGFLQWMRFNGFVAPSDPVLDPMETIENRDAILDLSDPDNPTEPDWPEAEFVVGNPPFLGGKMLRANLGDKYVDALFRVWGKFVKPEADLCAYWFEKARDRIQTGKTRRAGLLATQGIRGGANRHTLSRIKETGDIFFAVSDREWTLDGANVHISMVGFDDGSEKPRVLDGEFASEIHPNLTSGVNVTNSVRFPHLHELAFMADIKGGAFDLTDEVALSLVNEPNPHSMPNSDVVVPWVNGMDVTRRNRFAWIIDFGVNRTESDSALYEKPFEHLKTHVYPIRKDNNRETRRLRWWIHAETHPSMRKAYAPLARFLVTPNVTKHRLFAWISAPTLPDHQVIVFARSDNYFLGVLHSRVHEVWARAQGTQLREVESGFRYTPTTCFETFPFPEPSQAQRDAIAAAAKELDALRSNWLNPPEWTRTDILEFPGSADGPWKRYVHEPDGRGIGTVRYPRLVPKDNSYAALLKKRTLTNLYNERPAWLANTHRKLDEAVFAAYGWPAVLADDALLTKLLELNLSRAGTAADEGEECDA